MWVERKNLQDSSWETRSWGESFCQWFRTHTLWKSLDREKRAKRLLAQLDLARRSWEAFRAQPIEGLGWAHEVHPLGQETTATPPSPRPHCQVQGWESPLLKFASRGTGAHRGERVQNGQQPAKFPALVYVLWPETLGVVDPQTWHRLAYRYLQVWLR